MTNKESGNPGKGRLYGFLALSAGLMTALACLCGPLSGLPGVGGGAAATPTLIGSSNTGGTGGGTSGAFSFVDPGKAGLKSYHSKFTMTFTGTKADGTPDNGTVTIEQSHTSDPAATSFQMNGQGSALDQTKAGNTQMVVIGDTAYMVTDEGGTPKCTSMSGSAASGLLSSAYSPDTFMTGSDMSGAKRILPDETVNGILSQHWRFTNTDVQLLAPGWTSYTADAWIAVDGGYATKSTFVGDGQNVSGGGGKGHAEMQFDLLEANTDITIKAPDGCSAPAGGDIPKMPDATNSMSISGMTTYTTASAAADVVAFYQAQLPGAGWTAGTADTSGTPATLEFTKGSQTMTITIASEGGKTTVLIQVK